MGSYACRISPKHQTHDIHIKDGMRYLRIRVGLLPVPCVGDVRHAYKSTELTHLIEH